MLAPPSASLFDRVRPLLREVQSPSWYTGGEVNQVRKDPAATSGRMLLIYPDCYDVGMSHYGLKILYHIVNQEPDLAAERAFTPWPDFGAALERAGIPLYSLENHSPMADFDAIGFTIQSELTLTNLIYSLRSGQIPVLSAERTPDMPYVLCGGAGANGPEVLADVVDLFVLGEGEEVVAPLLRELADRRRAGEQRERVLRALVQRYPFLYAPSLYEEVWHDNGRYGGVRPRFDDVPDKVRYAYVYDFENTPFPTAPVVPHTRVVHDRIALEVMRGCVHGCRFCQAGMITRPWRIRSPQRLVELARQNYDSTGIEEISLLSLSTSDYPYLKEAVEALSREFEGCGVNISLPSLRVNQQLRLLPEITRNYRKAGLTMAPEVATDRLRAKVNKPIRNEDLYAGAREAFQNGWRHCKLYFMLGIPDELRSDLDGIVEMGQQVSDIGREVLGWPAAVDVSVSTFVPKPFTPYQWDGMVSIEETRERQRYLRSRARSKAVKLKFHNPEQSHLEGILARGDRRVGRALLRAQELGAGYDGWTEHFRWDLWQQAFADTGIDPEHYACRTIPYDEPLPWDHLEAGPSRDYLQQDSERARADRIRPHCFDLSCNKCGVDAKDCFDIKHAMKTLPLANGR